MAQRRWRQRCGSTGLMVTMSLRGNNCYNGGGAGMETFLVARVLWMWWYIFNDGDGSSSGGNRRKMEKGGSAHLNSGGSDAPLIGFTLRKN